jgi:hypothetical protein
MESPPKTPLKEGKKYLEGLTPLLKKTTLFGLKCQREMRIII